MSRSIDRLEGIGPKYAELLRSAGVRTVDDLLDKGGARAGRRVLAKTTGISESRILKCVNMADLFRINGVATQYAELLECAGVDTIKELKSRNAENLAEKMADINRKKNLVRRPPSTIVVQGWVSQALSLKARVSH